jgi:hypothetical protein
MLLAVLGAAALAGCGAEASSTDDFEGEERRVAQVVEDFQSAGEDEDSRRICRQILARTVVQRLREEDLQCEREIDRSLEETTSFELDVEDVRIRGDRAVAQVTSESEGEERTDRLTLVRERGAWRIAVLGTDDSG